MSTGISCFPESIVSRMIEHILPECDRITHQFCKSLQRLEVKLVVIRCFKFIAGGILHNRFWTWLSKNEIKIKAIHGKESSVVMDVITDEPIGNWSLWTNAFQCRMTAHR